jgi:hypothetical protein
LADTTNEDHRFLLLFHAYDDDGDDDGDDDDDGEVNGVHDKLDEDKINVQNDHNQVMDDADNDEKSVVNEHVLYDNFH